MNEYMILLFINYHHDHNSYLHYVMIVFVLTYHTFSLFIPQGRYLVRRMHL